MAIDTIPGGIPTSALGFSKRRTIRAEVNPLDKSTVVSIFPKELHEYKPTIMPGDFHIPAGRFENPSVLVVGPSSWWRDIDPDQPLLEITNSSIQVADSIVRDYCNGYIGCDMAESMPGLFYLPGDHSVKKVVTEFKAHLDRAKKRQDNWFRSLVKIADILWARSNGNPITIMDDMRLAARELGLDKEWIKDFHAAELIRCQACGNMRNPAYPVCAVCKWVDQTHPMAKDLKFAV